MYFAEEFAHLAIRRISRGNWVQLMCLKATADFYGWSSIFPPLLQAKRVDYPGNVFPMPGRLTARQYRGTRLRICRKKTNNGGNPAGLTNCFRVSNNATNLDLTCLAQAVSVDFGWMNDKSMARIPRDRWLSRHLPDTYCNFDITAANF